MSSTAQTKALYGDPYVLCFGLAIQHVLRWAEQGVPAAEQLGVIVDQDDCGRMLNAAASYHVIRERWDPKSRLGPVQFADKKKVIPLQTPDMLAHQVFQHLRDGLVDQGRTRNVLSWMLEAIPEERQLFIVLDADGLREVQEGLRRDGLV